jgi:hypothetical protein
MDKGSKEVLTQTHTFHQTSIAMDFPFVDDFKGINQPWISTAM